MFVRYKVIWHGMSIATIAFATTFTGNAPLFTHKRLAPSDCEWLIPGTVDPND
jgi:hypothetical protein